MSYGLDTWVSSDYAGSIPTLIVSNQTDKLYPGFLLCQNQGWILSSSSYQSAQKGHVFSQTFSKLKSLSPLLVTSATLRNSRRCETLKQSLLQFFSPWDYRKESQVIKFMATKQVKMFLENWPLGQRKWEIFGQKKKKTKLGQGRIQSQID